ncbi:MAG: hypothetical protein H6642_07130 [Caldilineaceae bacterium]|nr:hypothetical protein [Caldilineaceae bacterium]
MIDNTIEKDDPLVVVGVLPDGEWYLLDSGGWVHERHVAGRLPDDVAVVTPLPTNTPTVTNTPLPSDTPTITPTGTDTPIPTDTPLPTNTSAAANTPLPTDTPVAQRSESIDLMLPVTSRDSNLRGGPGTGYGIVGSASAGEALDVTGQNGAGDWLQLATGVWIARSLVDNVPDDLPVVESLPAPVQAEPTSVPADQPEAPQENPQAFTCVGGCAEPPDPSCAIKGNVNNKGDRIYHMPGWRDYNRTDIKPEQGDRWFCTAAEAEAAGFRRPERY